MQELDFSKISVKIPLTPEYILSKIDQIAIMMYYLGSFKIGKAFNSPFRKDDLASAGVFIHTNGTLLFKDFKTSEVLNCFQVVKKKCNCNFAGCLQIIAEDFGLLNRQSRIPKSFYKELEDLDKEIKKETLIQFEPEPWTRKNSLFWRRGDITIEELNASGDIFYTKTLYINHQEIYNPNKFHRYAYVQKCEIKNKIESRVKVYSPQDNKMKFVSSIPLGCMGGIFDLPKKDDRVSILKSRKDALVAQKFFTDVCWTNNESLQAFPDAIQKRLLGEYKEAYIVYGSDPHAVEVSKKLTERGFKYFNTYKSDYEKYKCEDLFDISTMFGIDEVKVQLKSKNLI